MALGRIRARRASRDCSAGGRRRLRLAAKSPQILVSHSDAVADGSEVCNQASPGQIRRGLNLALPSGAVHIRTLDRLRPSVAGIERPRDAAHRFSWPLRYNSAYQGDLRPKPRWKLSAQT